MKLFLCDYQEGAHPDIMEALLQTNLEQTCGYGLDGYCEEAAELIKRECGRENIFVHFLVGGTQTNATVIAAALRPYEGVLSPVTGHINTHETGAIEACGHKVLPLDANDGKITAEQIEKAWYSHVNDETKEHNVKPGMVYISFPTELGTLYKKAELEKISKTCRECGLYLYVDGARMGYGLMSGENDLTLADFAKYCDAFYIGGTKVGALFGEALVIMNEKLNENFRYMIKQKGGLLAKGRLLGIQFKTLFKDGLYYRISQNAIDKAMKLKTVFEDKGYSFFAASPTNQQFPMLPDKVYEALKDRCEFWNKPDSTHTTARFCTSWATEDEAVREVEKILEGFK